MTYQAHHIDRLVRYLAVIAPDEHFSVRYAALDRPRWWNSRLRAAPGRTADRLLRGPVHSVASCAWMRDATQRLASWVSAGIGPPERLPTLPGSLTISRDRSPPPEGGVRGPASAGGADRLQVLGLLTGLQRTAGDFLLFAVVVVAVPCGTDPGEVG